MASLFLDLEKTPHNIISDTKSLDSTYVPWYQSRVKDGVPPPNVLHPITQTAYNTFSYEKFPFIAVIAYLMTMILHRGVNLLIDFFRLFSPSNFEFRKLCS